MALDSLRSKAFFQNTIDVWITFCQEGGQDWYDPQQYRRFIQYLLQNNVKMQKFPLCIKESGGMYERGKDKARFLEELSKLSTDDSSAFTLKLSNEVMAIIRKFNASLTN